MLLSALPPELLESVLRQLPHKDLLLAQRLCETIRNAIVAFPSLQAALWNTMLPTDGMHLQKTHRNQLFVDKLLHWHYAESQYPEIPCTRSYRMSIAPNLPEVPGPKARIMIDQLGRYSKAYSTPLTAEDSQHRMLLCRRPYEIKLFINGKNRPDLPAGAVFGDVVARVEEFEREQKHRLAQRTARSHASDKALPKQRGWSSWG